MTIVNLIVEEPVYTPVEKSDADILAESREYIEENGWIQGTIQDAHGSVCGLGGIVVSQDWMYHEEQTITLEIRRDRHSQVKRIIFKVLGALGVPIVDDLPYEMVLMSLTNWNDQKERTEQQVLDAFAKAEKIERAGFDPDAP